MGDEQIPVGIQPLFTALVYEAKAGSAEEQRDVYQADTPSLYAEARLGIAGPRQIADQLKWVTYGVRKGDIDAPFLEKWLRENNRLGISDLEAAAFKHNKSAAMVREEAIEKAGESEQGTLTAMIKARETGVAKDTLKYWDVEMSNYTLINDGFDLNPSFRRNCQCGFTGKHTNKRKLWDANLGKERKLLDELVKQGHASHKDIGRELHISCYHEAALATAMELQNDRGKYMGIQGLKEPTKIAFDFIDKWDLVFEEFARRYKFGQLYAETDNFLFGNDVVTPYFKQLIAEGKVNKEIVKKSRHFEPIQRDVIINIHRMLADKGFEYKGFANEFVGIKNQHKDYRTVGMVFENPTRDTSYTIVYDNTLWMPYLVKKDFVNVPLGRGNQLHQRNPIKMAYGAGRSHIYQLDDRTQRIADVAVIEPMALIADVPGAKAKYERYKNSLLR
jgi:hypothetical protein